MYEKKEFEYGLQDENEMTVTLTLDDNSELECVAVAVFSVQGKDYIALLPLGVEGDEVYLYRFKYNGGEDPELENIEDDEEFELVADTYDDLEALKATEDDNSYWTDCGLIEFESRVINYIDECSMLKEPDLERIFNTAYKFNENDRVSEYAFRKLLQLYGTGKFVCSNGDTATFDGFPDLNKFKEISASADIGDLLWSLCDEFLEAAERIDEYLTADEIELFEAAMLAVGGESCYEDGNWNTKAFCQEALFGLYYRGVAGDGVHYGCVIPELEDMHKAAELLSKEEDLLGWIQCYCFEDFVEESPEKWRALLEEAYKHNPSSNSIGEALLRELLECDIKRFDEVLDEVPNACLIQFFELHDDLVWEYIYGTNWDDADACVLESCLLTIIESLTKINFESPCLDCDELKYTMLSLYEDGWAEGICSCPSLKSGEKAAAFAAKHGLDFFYDELGDSENELVIALRYSIDQPFLAYCIANIKSAIEKYAPETCVLDFSIVTVTDEIGMSIIANVLSIMEARNGKLMVCNMRESLMKAFAESDVSKKVEILEDDE